MTSNGSQLAMTSSPPISTATVTISTTASPQTVVIKGKRFRQRPLGPAPFASFEDLSDELDSPPEAARVPLPGIKEDPASQIQTPNTPQPQMMTINLTEQEEQGLKEALAGSLDTPAPPRIDISRASSSSQHEDSITSSPEHEGTKNLGYKEDGTLDLRSSTEELDYIQEPGTVEETEAKRKREKMMKKQQQLKQDFGDTQSEYDIKERKDSNCSVMSDVGLLCISGRTSRLSSIGSAASGASGASAASGASHLSVGSHLSGRSTRSPSPHKMLLETSFCGSKPMHTQSIEAEAAPALVSHVEKPASRPPSRLRSRSPSPHKMLLETSFCGTKAIIPPSDAEKAVDVKERPTKKRAKSLTPGFVTTAEIAPQKPRKSDVSKPVAKPEVEHPAESVPKPEKKIQPKMDEIKRADEVKEVPKRVMKAKPVSLPKLIDKKPVKPKKVISLRDIPADEIYIPLKGPEVDFEEIIRKASPNLRRKGEQPPPPKSKKTDSPDEIYIPLHSPPKETSEKEESEKQSEESGSSTFKQNFDDGGIYIPLHSPPKSPKTVVDKSSDKKMVVDKKSEVKIKTSLSSVVGDVKYQKKTYEPKKTKPYEVCEDGSIFIPLHSPEEERNARTFEEEIRRVDQELQKAREAAERRQREEEKQQSKPVTLDLNESQCNRSRLSQTFPSGRPELTSGSRTPSPGSSLSRKSSFASLFRKSDVSCSPDSPAGSLARKKSGTFTNILKEASDGLRERSRSRSKSRERQPHASVVRSPSIKKNVFTNLFTKKKADNRPVSGKADDEPPPRLDLQFTFKTESESKSSEGDYIIIPLRDPSDPPASLDDDTQEVDKQEEVTVERPASPVVILERSGSPKSIRRSREIEDHIEIIPRSESKRSIDRRSITKDRRGDDQVSIGDDRRSIGEDRRSIASDKRSAVQSPEFGQEAFTLSTVGAAYTAPSPGYREEKEGALREKTKAKSREKTPSPKPEHIRPAKEKTPSPVVEQTQPHQESLETIDKIELLDPKKFEDMALQHDSSIDLEEDTVKEEMVAVSSGGVRKLKLPPEPGDLEEDHERKGLVLQESFDDELPYVPTTLPLERSMGVPIVPVKHRVAEIKTCPIERPRSTTPINPAALEEYVCSKEPVRRVSAEEKIKISIPRDDSITSKSKSPRRLSGAKGKSWFEFAEAGLQSPRDYRKSSLTTTPSPPPLPPRASPPTTGLSSSAPQSTASWINFDELPEKRKLPKRITTVPPLRSSVDGGALPEKSSASSAGNVVYSYVSPEDCQCECHDHSTSHSTSHVKESDSKRGTKQKTMIMRTDGDITCELYLTQSQQTKRKLIKPQGDSEKSVTNECEDCESGRHEEVEGDIEERPLLDNNSDVENDDSTSRKENEWELVVPGSRLEVDRQSYLSDSSYDYTSHEATSTGGLDNSVSEVGGMKPFSMDLDVHSNRSSIVSQDEQPSPEEVSNSLPP